MKQAVVQKDDFTSFIRSIGKECRVYGPAKVGDVICLAEITDGQEIELTYANSRVGLKSLFAPQHETICTFEGGAGRDVRLPDEKAFVFGARPCDARALPIMDKVFGGEIEDPYYLSRRNNTLVISLACNDPSGTCFCTALGGSPSGKQGSDILAFDLGDVLLLEETTAKGREFIEKHLELFQPAIKTHLKCRDDLASEAVKKIADTVEMQGVTKKLESCFESPIWDEIHEACLACGICTFLCPTCHCFTFSDERAGAKGERIRLWDSCQYPSFTLEASGHNPRISSRERMRQRIMHKFSYYVDNFDEVACVGCGRCVANCPVNLDLREIIASIEEEC